MIGGFVLGILGIALLAYTLTGGADFGVGIMETFASRADASRIRKLGEKAIAPIWEANHVWLILALVILFVGYPDVHVAMTTSLHFPLLLMLVGIVVRGTAFTFRYYDVGEDLSSSRLWTLLFRGASVLVPLCLGHLAAALHRGTLLATPTTVWETYLVPWIGWFPLATGLFTIAVFAWSAAVFLLGEVPILERRDWFGRTRRHTIVMLVCGVGVAAAGWWEGVPLLQSAMGAPLVWASVAVATVSLVGMSRESIVMHVARLRGLCGLVVACILVGYFAAAYPTALQYSDGTVLSWPAAQAPQSTLTVLAIALVVGAITIFPSLFWLYRIFKSQPR